MTDDDLDARLEDLPLFPLPRVVLLPGELLPLHVFEPRYRALVAHLLEGDRVLGIATLRPGFEGEYEGSPPLYREVGVGRVVRHQGLPEGRANILVEHVAAARVVQELSTDEPFRRVRAERIRRSASEACGGPSLRVLATQVAAAVGPLGARERLFQLRGTAFVDAMARLFVQDVGARRAYLASEDAAACERIVEEALLDWLTRVGPPGEDA